MRETRKPNVRQVIDIHDAANCHYWTRALGVNMADLKKAVREVGPSADEVRQYLAIKHNRHVQREMT